MAAFFCGMICGFIAGGLGVVAAVVGVIFIAWLSVADENEPPFC
jgi:hypothetical protein